ncbi:hypothetical protein MCOR02_001385 [Pyricularia oryzae]|nr:hypothetical protein MCOR02_001385 [Pyricularia oryzae]KAI6256110.1 hypothetical protein MCOR19_007386 [Pyricularia oryzae]KAI6413340.1 hypothetical protein MCOR20_002966 [Pyricularia oryzae]KAI6447502.1 hypothetical protein MCOR15_010200 [Pyricularia oryzae]KAI6592219.1 hypothetical protein MCOR06_004263 [Pyricularia oryzae]
MSSSLTSPGLTQALYAGNAFMMRKISRRKGSAEASIRLTAEGDAWHHDIMAYLGAMNSSLALLAILRIYALARPSRAMGGKDGDVAQDVTALIVLGLANFSQAFLNFTLSRRSDRWIMGKGLDRITVLDAVFTVLDWAAAIGRLVA